MNDQANISNEERLLIGLCRLQFNDVQAKQLREIASSVHDWDTFVRLADSHGIAALTYQNMDRFRLLKNVPEESVNRLRGSLMKSISRNAFHTMTIATVLNLLNAHNIKTVLLKGMALENSVYGNSGIRQMSDVDILIEKGECIRARDILIKDGFVSLPVKSVFHKYIITEIGKHIPSLLKNGESIEIHHDLFSDEKRELTKVFYETSVEIQIKGEKAYIPLPQINFLYLVNHLHRHERNNESQLRLYTDLVVMLEKYHVEIINYDLLSLASQAGLAESLACYLDLLKKFWGIRFPGWTDDFILKFCQAATEEKFLFFLGSPKDNPPSDKQGVYRNMIREISGSRNKILYVLGDLFPTITFMKKRYKCSGTLKVLIYYPQRFGKLLWLIRK